MIKNSNAHGRTIGSLGIDIDRSSTSITYTFLFMLSERVAHIVRNVDPAPTRLLVGRS
jgi:hypothetical protein